MRKTVDNLKLRCNNCKGNNRKLIREKVCKQQHLLEHFGTEDHSDFYMAWKFFLLIGQTLRNVEKQPPEVFCKKMFLKIWQNSHESTAARVSFLINLLAYGTYQL